MRKMPFGLAAVLLLAILPAPARAGCNALSLCSCTASASGMAFGNYDPLSGSAATSSGTVTVDCTLTVALPGSYDIALGPGSSGGYSPRRMANGGSTLDYNLYTSPAFTQVWGDGSGGSANVSRSFTALLFFSQTTTIYGRIPASQNVPAGSYGDTILVTVTF